MITIIVCGDNCDIGKTVLVKHLAKLFELQGIQVITSNVRSGLEIESRDANFEVPLCDQIDSLVRILDFDGKNEVVSFGRGTELRIGRK